MRYASAAEWLGAPNRRISLFGMSGLGKTRLSKLLRAHDWFHYSVDFRIGTRYMGEHIVDNFKSEAMRVPFLRSLLLSDSIIIGSNISFNNLEPLATYLGKPGDPARGGLSLDEYLRRQRQHRQAEIAACLDVSLFIDKAKNIYGYDDFVADMSGSLCEVVDPDDADDPVMTAISSETLPVWIRGDDAHIQTLAERFDRNPKPMYYSEAFLLSVWHAYLARTGLSADAVDPDAFIRHGYRELLSYRRPRYRAIAQRWGVTVDAGDVEKVRDADDFIRLVADAIAARGANKT